MTLPLHVNQRESHDCGVACVAMAANVNYDDARNVFKGLGLHIGKRGRHPYASNFKHVQEALTHLGCNATMRKFYSWDQIKGPTIVKVDNGHPRNWHWVYATRMDPWGLVVLDPELADPYLEHPPMDVCTVALPYFKPKGNILVVERPKASRVHALSKLQRTLSSLHAEPGLSHAGHALSV